MLLFEDVLRITVLQPHLHHSQEYVSITKITFPAERISSTFQALFKFTLIFKVPATSKPISSVTTRLSSKMSGYSFLLQLGDAHPS